MICTIIKKGIEEKEQNEASGKRENTMWEHNGRRPKKKWKLGEATINLLKIVTEI